MRAMYKQMSFARLRWLRSEWCRKFSSGNADPHVAIVGSGPAGFYTAQQLLKGHQALRVDIYEKLPVPFGLVRFGVAPDHPEVKNCINSFTHTAQDARCSFIGNVEVGKDVTVAQLQQAYTAVVLCHGASNDRCLDIPGENLPNVLSARSFVGWYNGLPEDTDVKVNLDCETAVVLGHGNVALDVARILLTPVDILAKTDISDYSLEALSRSRIKKVVTVGRRGPLQVAFTIKELREMITLPKCCTVLDPRSMAGINEKVINDLPRPRRRLTDLLYTTAVKPAEKYIKMWADATREWQLQFLRSPTEILTASNEQGLEGVSFVINQLEGNVPAKQKAVPTEQTEVIPCGLVLRSIGYSGVPIDHTVPFDTNQGLIPNACNRVHGCSGLYSSGWSAHGPVFVILGAMNDGFATGKTVLADIASGQLSSENKSGKQSIIDHLHEKGVQPVTFTDWEKIDRVEILRGEKTGKPREKITSVEEMLHIASS